MFLETSSVRAFAPSVVEAAKAESREKREHCLVIEVHTQFDTVRAA